MSVSSSNSPETRRESAYSISNKATKLLHLPFRSSIRMASRSYWCHSQSIEPPGYLTRSRVKQITPYAARTERRAKRHYPLSQETIRFYGVVCWSEDTEYSYDSSQNDTEAKVLLCSGSLKA